MAKGSVFWVVCNKMDTTYVLAIRGAPVMFQFLFYWCTTSSYTGEAWQKNFFQKSYTVLQMSCHIGTFCVTYETVKGESLKVKVYFKCIEGILEGNYPSQILQITWNLSNESYFQCSFYFPGVLWYKHWWSMFLFLYVTTGHWWLLTQPPGV